MDFEKMGNGTCTHCAYNDETCSMCVTCDNYSSFCAKSNRYPDKRPAATPEPMSKPGIDDVLPELIKDLEARTAVGVKSYGKPLQSHIGRDPLMDAYQESLDQCQYLKQAIMEREKPFSECIREWAKERKLYDTATPYSQMKKLVEEVFEWFDEVKDGNEDSEKMELGDCMVVLQNIANMRGYDIDECKWMAYHKIKNRSGKTINGTFVKNETV